ncbi:hypothetical protein SAMN05880593_101339 [Rhizobium sp. RU36D]|nr:hypothetical protein SAMN05880593_101339 [Rhizobium sp. RU36D]
MISWIKIANPAATDTEITEAYELFEKMRKQYDICAKDVTREVGTKVPVTTRASMVVEILHRSFPMFGLKTIEKFSWDEFISNR